MVLKRTTPSDLPDPTSSSKGGLTLGVWDGGSGTATYAVNGNTAVNFSAGGGNNVFTRTKVSMTNLTNTTHSVVITGQSGGTDISAFVR
jgi:hypothetical protein